MQISTRIGPKSPQQVQRARSKSKEQSVICIAWASVFIQKETDRFMLIHELMHCYRACLCYVYRKLPAAGKAILVTSTTAMRAANISDFYMTKYLSKSQEDLGSTMQPFLAGMRRMEESEYRTERPV